MKLCMHQRHQQGMLKLLVFCLINYSYSFVQTDTYCFRQVPSLLCRCNRRTNNHQRTVGRRNIAEAFYLKTVKDDDDGFDIFNDLNVNGDTTNNDNKKLSIVEDQLSSRPIMITNEIDNNNNNNNNTKIGIGGKGGVTYDVNRLKKNLVQETVSEYKKSLMDIIGTPYQTNEGMIDERLSTLVQCNPVSTTTDSNLLDGGIWSHVFGSRRTTAQDILLGNIKSSSTSNFLSIQQQQQQGEDNDDSLKKLRYVNPFRSMTRKYNLEDLDDDEDAYMIDETRILGGFITKSRKFNVLSLTRTSIQLAVVSSYVKLFNKYCIRNKQYDEEYNNNYDFDDDKLFSEIKILYLDSDLCVSTSLSSSDGLDGPFHVYTKSDAWVGNVQKTKRKIRFVNALCIWSLFKIRRALSWVLLPTLFRSRRKGGGGAMTPVNNNDAGGDSIITERQIDDQRRLRVVKIGETGSYEEDAWEGKDDPFVHLSADERQQLIKDMTFKDIQLEKDRFEKIRKKKDRRINNPFTKKNQFRKPKQQEKE